LDQSYPSPRILPDDGFDQAESPKWDSLVLGARGSSFDARHLGRVLQQLLTLSPINSDDFETTIRPTVRVSYAIQQSFRLFDEVRPAAKPLLVVPLPEMLFSSNSVEFRGWLSRALRTVGLSRGRLDETGEHLVNAVFQPCQNAVRYGRSRSDDRPNLRTVSFCVRSYPKYALRSFEAYLNGLNRREIRPDRFLEIIVCDAGPGIARHFYSAQMNTSEKDLLAETIEREWLQLKLAFEQHRSSRPNFSLRQANRALFQPGVGLFAMLSGLRMLNGFLEVRTGRLRLFRWAFRDEEFDVGDLLWPRRVPVEAKAIRGTIIRMLVPLKA
jgi:hypothetical protein